jgi:hypothetical protein
MDWQIENETENFREKDLIGIKTCYVRNSNYLCRPKNI